MSQQPQECHLYQLFPPALTPSPSSPEALSPVNSPIPLSSASSMRVASVQTLLESSFLHSGLKFVEVIEISQRFHINMSKKELLYFSYVWLDVPTRLPLASCCSCRGSGKTSKCLTPSCRPSAWTSQTCWMTVRTITGSDLFLLIEDLK